MITKIEFGQMTIIMDSGTGVAKDGNLTQAGHPSVRVESSDRQGLLMWVDGDGVSYTDEYIKCN